MQTLLLISVLIVTIWLPSVAARYRDPRRAIWAVAVRFVAFCTFYLFALRFIYPRLS